MRTPVIYLIALAILSFSLLAAAAEPQTITGTIGKSDKPADTIAVLGHNGVLFIRSEGRWMQLQKLFDSLTFTPDTPVRKIDFTKQNLVLLYKVYCRRADSLSINKSDLAATRPSLDCLLRWDNGPTTQPELSVGKFILAIIPASPTVQVTVSSEAINVDKSRNETEFSATLGDKDGGDIVDFLQAAIKSHLAAVKPGEDILFDFELHLADMPNAKPKRFGPMPDTMYVWDAQNSIGYRNHGFFVTTPNGKTKLLQPKEIEIWERNAPHPVQITAKQPYNLWGDNPHPVSLKDLGLDTTALGTYTITGLYTEQGSEYLTPDLKPNINRAITLWGGSIASNTITVEVKN